MQAHPFAVPQRPGPLRPCLNSSWFALPSLASAPCCLSAQEMSVGIARMERLLVVSARPFKWEALHTQREIGFSDCCHKRCFDTRAQVASGFTGGAQGREGSLLAALSLSTLEMVASLPSQWIEATASRKLVARDRGEGFQA